jgi:predicted secreted hydrolase
MIKLLVITLLILSIFGCQEPQEVQEDSELTVSKAMGDLEGQNFSKALNKRAFTFPQDHGSHPDYRTEWWYFTGNLSSSNNRQFGYQFTIFRTGLTREKSERESQWNSNQIYMAHFAVSDISEKQFYFAERFGREGNQLSGAQIDPLKIWQEDWQIVQSSERIFFELPELIIQANTGSVKIDLTVRALKPFVLQGDKGLSQKSGQPGNASYYYSYTRLQTEGTISIEDETFPVKGTSWLDREWSTSALGEDQQGWDWFALQLEDNTEIMYYQMRKTDGNPDDFSKGILVKPDGSSSLITKDEVKLNVLEEWISPQGSKYPSGWRLQIPGRKIDLTITPTFKNQLLDVTIKYWEGAVTLEGQKKGEEIKGRGYVELTGY